MNTYAMVACSKIIREVCKVCDVPMICIHCRRRRESPDREIETVQRTNGPIMYSYMLKDDSLPPGCFVEDLIVDRSWCLRVRTNVALD